MNIHRYTIYNSQKLETAQMSINWWDGEPNELQPYNKMLFGHKKEWRIDTCYNMILENNTLSEKSQSQKTRWCMIPLIRTIQD
jgi:hypothetical protein